MQNICYNCFHYAPEGQACPYCKYDPRENEGRYRLALRPGTILANRYLIGRVLGQGGFGITYVALDNQTKSRVAIKEYMPTEYASRDEGTVGLRLNDNSVQADFDYGKEQFLQEAKTLAAFVGNEHIIGVRDMFEANETAYFAMEFAEGVSLKQYMEQRGGPLQVYETNLILLPIMEALQWVHSKGIVHRDIAPDNIIIKRDGTAKLIDFGAARYSTGEKSKSLDVILKHGFAPMEQYNRRGRQGPFTDVYAMAATYYYAITGRVPPDAIERIEEDTIQPPSAYGVRIRKETEEVLLKALAVSSKNRYQTMAEFYTALLSSMPKPFDPDTEIGETAAQTPVQPVKGSTPPPVARPPKKEEPKHAPQPQKKLEPVADKPKKKTPIIAIAAIIVVCILTGVLFGTGAFGKKSSAISEPTHSSAPIEAAEPMLEVQETAETPETKPEPELDPLKAYQTVGSIVTFGAYEQDNDTSNGKEPIEWIVLDVQDGMSLLISRYALDRQEYNTGRANVTWEICSLRTWLNDTFLKEAFSAEEQDKIPMVTVTADKNPSYSTDTGKDTQDRVFLLSIPEVNSYFASDKARQCTPTAYAIAQGSAVVQSLGTCDWWLRSPGGDSTRAAHVSGVGSVNYGGYFVNLAYNTVRPALWIDLNKIELTTNGKTVTFGAYEQDNDTSNGKEPIEWIVLDVQDSRSLVISKYALDCKSYNTSSEEVTWETCSLRAWLNGIFVKEAFSAEEQDKIPTVPVTADKNLKYGTDPGKDTQDRVFLLSIPEASSYFASNEARRCKPTAYAISQGSAVYQSLGTCDWWLRSPGNNSNSAANADNFGSVGDHGDHVSYGHNAVRPALWIDLDS